MAELVYPPILLAAKTLFRVLDNKFTIEGTEHIPATGGAVIACNHIGYLDFIYCGLGALPAKRLVRFMAKKEIFENKIAGPLMRGMHHIPVDRDAGMASFREGVTRLKAGEVVGIFPEATISQSFTVKEIKSGAVRMASAAGVPIIPMALWGTQRLWTKGRPKTLTKRHVPISILVGEPILPVKGEDRELLAKNLRTRMSELVDQVQAAYPESPNSADDKWWMPAHLGGTAPTPEEAASLDDKRS
jgi:1-acyl-sn-glycerol-3-phosphate acyltransferase